MNWVPQMNFEKAMNTTFLFVGGAISIARGSLLYSLENTYVQKLSISEIVKTSSLVFSLDAVIQIAVTKIFEELGVENPYDWRCFMVRTFSMFSSTLIAGAAAVGFGFVKNASAAISASLIGFHILVGAGAIALGVHNLTGGDHQYFL